MLPLMQAPTFWASIVDPQARFSFSRAEPHLGKFFIPPERKQDYSTDRTCMTRLHGYRNRTSSAVKFLALIAGSLFGPTGRKNDLQQG